ncbi:sensor histidine kinase [Phenylobacterium sp.]|uniref:sensor histidine kinase n=1 Tax=Phenylobacterium sp. TaxID=1871053 RepID=UPI0027162D8C|nr:histidine kinase dimerization/phosphoacceptor domain -containing protein [Phenylobacterium sp.]MDO8380115.1 histidine kinase dimerization/phosphoacceptor domain -containing protein [Phenylobacterium sp.]
MTPPDERLEQLLNTPDLAGVLESSSFRQFLDQVPIAIAVSELEPAERIVYANVEFERLTGRAAADLEGEVWTTLSGQAAGAQDGRRFSDAITEDQDFIGAFDLTAGEQAQTVDAWSNLIQDSAGDPVFRMLALVEAARRGELDLSDFEQRIHDKDVQLKELQHRVGNNLQMITALIRIEARNVPENAKDERFARLAGRVEALGLLYRSLSEEGHGESIDLGVYLSQVASAVMKAHAVEGIHLDLQVDTWPVSINVAMPAGLVVNELLTNALKHAFKGREGGTIKLRSLVDETGCRVVVADDGVGLAPGEVWPRAGKLSALIVQSLRQNAKAQVEVEPNPGTGLRVSVFFARADAAPET